MHRLRTLTAAIAVAAAAAVVATAAPAFADPPTGSNGKEIVPQSYDIVAVGANTDENLFNQLSADYNKTIPAKEHGPSHPYFYSFNATVPGSTSTKSSDIVPKQGCKPIVRPNGSKDGLEALEAAQKIGKYYCVDFARSSSGRSTAPSSVTYVAFARDAITWATRSAAHGGSDAPPSLTLPQLRGIFSCKTTNWKSVGGKPGAVKVYLPQAGSGTLSSWEKFLGITKLGKCVDQAPEENEGTYFGFNTKNAVFIYSIADYVAQKYHKNAFGSNVTGVLGINKIDKISPITTAAVPTINPNFPAGFFRTIYNIVRGTHSIDPRLVALLGPKGYVCTNPTAKKDIVDYGFLLDSKCGSLS
jgi:phosphate transport system substrate-binding protein